MVAEGRHKFFRSRSTNSNRTPSSTMHQRHRLDQDRKTSTSQAARQTTDQSWMTDRALLRSRTKRNMTSTQERWAGLVPSRSHVGTRRYRRHMKKDYLQSVRWAHARTHATTRKCTARLGFCRQGSSTPSRLVTLLLVVHHAADELYNPRNRTRSRSCSAAPLRLCA